MEYVWSNNNDEKWGWNWTEFCGHKGGINPINPETRDLSICFQQFCLQVPVLALIAIMSGYYCGKHNTFRDYHSYYSINIRVFLTACLAVLPIIRAYIILFHSTAVPGNNTTQIIRANANNEDDYSTIPRRDNYEAISITTLHKVSSAKPIDYLVAGTEGLAWFVHLCFILSLKKSRCNPRGPVFIRALILLLTVISILLLRSHINHKPEDDVLPNLSLGFSISVVTLLAFYTLMLIPSHGVEETRPNSLGHVAGERTALLNSPSPSSYIRFPEQQDPNYLGTAMEHASYTSKLLFYWVNPLMEKGVHGLLNHSDDLFDLPEEISTSAIGRQINKCLGNKQEISADEMGNSRERISESDVTVVGNRMTLLRLLHKCFGWQFYTVGVLKFLADCSTFVGPLCLNRIIGFIEDKNEPPAHGYLYAILIFLSALIGAICNAHFTFWMTIVGLKIRSCIVTLVYRKTLHSSSIELNRYFNFGEIMNFMTTDNDRVVNSCPSFHTFWSIPFQLAVTLYLLYTQIGVSFLAGVAFAIILMPINKKIANKIGSLSTHLMSWKDKRVRLMGEILRGMTTIKLNVWEEHFLRNILKLRANEIKYLSGRKYMDALCVYFWATTPVLISILTFATYVLLGHQLNAKTVFTSMALLNMLIGPLNAFPWVLNGLTEAWVSIRRIQRLLDLPDMNIQSYYSEPDRGMDVMLKNATFEANISRNRKLPATKTSTQDVVSPSASTENKKTVSFEDDGVFALQDVNFSVTKGQLIGVMGKVGSGKSLLLNGILAEVRKTAGTVAVNALDEGFAYVKQNPWLQRGTIRDNILFGKMYDFNKYKNVLKACALTDDLNALPKGDLTAVGEAGNTLSGGQRTRISLARAVYADKDIYLLDDVLSTLDVKVANYIFQNVILDVLKNKTRIFCTHQTHYLIHADTVFEMSKGRIIRQGKPCDILPNLEDYLLSVESAESSLDVQSIKELPKELGERTVLRQDPLLDEEFTEKGTVRFGVYGTYIKAVSRYLAISIFLSMVLMQSSKNVSDLWLSHWVTHINASTINSTSVDGIAKLQYFIDDGIRDNRYYLTIYGVLAVSNTVFTLIRAFVFAYGGIKAAVVVHRQLLKVIMRARSTFFDTQPLGRIINRFSSDTYTIDDSLPFIANILLAQVFALIATIIVTAYGLPWIFLVLAPLVPIYHWVQNHYRLTSRELKRLSSIALSPLYAHFNETLTGLTTIRAFRAVPRFKHENDLFFDASQKTQFASVAISQWLALRLQFIGVALLGGVSILAVLQHQYNIADPGLIGLSITYILSITGILAGVVNAFTETEREMVAVERVKQYLEDIPTENTSGENPPYGWPTQGVIEFHDVVLKYRNYLEPSLKYVSFVTRPAEKIGVVGRTGAGKSSIFVSLFRLVDINSGEIFIDNVNIQSIQLYALRSRLAIIPQNPFIFSGSVRENVDPLNQYTDHHIYKALEKCKIHTLVYRLGGLGALLEEGGNNLSAGQKQLVCLVRAVLHNAKIVCIDEATANVDQETDKCIQATLKSSFRSATVITIAHRIRTIMHCDRVLVMGDGEVLEFDEPNLLIDNPDSYFYNLASEEFTEKE